MLMRAAKRLVCAVVVSNLIIGPVATAQQSNPPATNAGSPGTQTTPVSVSKPTGTKKPTAAPDPTAPPAKPATPIKPSLQSEIAKGPLRCSAISGTMFHVSLPGMLC